MSRRDPSMRSPPWCDECNQHRDDCDCEAIREAAEWREKVRKVNIARALLLSPQERRQRLGDAT